MLSNLRESFVEVLAVPRIEDGFAAGSDSDGAIAVQFYFVGPLRSFGKLWDHGAFHRLDEFGLSLQESFNPSCAASPHTIILIIPCEFREFGPNEYT
jgi:hypothetical protein